MSFVVVLFFSFCIVSQVASIEYSIDSFGAIPNNSTPTAATANSIALMKALAAANRTSNNDVVVIPHAQTYDIFHVKSDRLLNVTLRVDGTLRANDQIDLWLWPIDNRTGGDEDWAVLQFTEARGFHLTGNGTIDGQGYPWWINVISGAPDERPHLVICTRCVDLEIDSIVARNSPQFHFKIIDVRGFYAHDMRIVVDVVQQQSMLDRAGFWHPKLSLPTFPLNTDGIDPSGTDVLIERVRISNFDDAVAVKPSNSRNISPCSERMVIRDSWVQFSVGMTIGSLAPSPYHNCIRDIVFQNIEMVDPIKAIYVKSNPGNVGTGLIENIAYRNLTGTGAIWYPIWIGPQQQHQPNTPGNPCSFLFALDPSATCETNPLVTIRNISLIDVHFQNTLLVPGVFWCDPVAPCTGFVVQNVVNQGPFGLNSTYRCQNMLQPSISGQFQPDFSTCQ
jgi:polygalacturonase